MTRVRVVAVVASVLAVGLVGYAFTAPRGERSIRQFEPDRLADLELRMWQAYYAKENVRLFGLLVAMLREQYHYPWATAAREGFHLARAAATFGNLRGNYDVVIPDLEAAYGTARSWLGAGFDPAVVARAELAWWVARRIPGQNDPAQVGALIADQYAMLYEAPRPAVERSALLRAQAAALRDAQAERPDWTTIGGMLRDSYRDLHAGLARPRSSN
jgi:hypothetical protein